MIIQTVGHGTLPQDDFAALVRDAGVAEIVDIRSFPGSRRHPQFGTAEMANRLPEHAVAYRWMLPGVRRRHGDRAVPHRRRRAARAW